MNLSFLLPLLRETTAYKQLVEQLLAAKNGHKVVILDAAESYFIAALHDELRLPVIVISAQPERTRRLLGQLQIWCPPSVNLHRFPELEFLLYEYPSSPSANAIGEKVGPPHLPPYLARDNYAGDPPHLPPYLARDVWERLRVLSTLCHCEERSDEAISETRLLRFAHNDQNKCHSEHRDYYTTPSPASSLRSELRLTRVTAEQPPLIVTSALAVIAKTISQEDFTSACHILTQGMVIDPLSLLRRWQLMGYETEDIVEVPGTMSRRGGIVDVFSPCSQMPARIEFLGNKIESIRLFDPESQCSTKPVESIVIIPAKEVGMFENSGSLLNYLPGNAVLVLDSPGEIKTAIEKLHREAQELREVEVAGQKHGSLERGELPENLHPHPSLSLEGRGLGVGVLRSRERSLFTWEELEPEINARRCLSLEPWNIAESGVQFLPFTLPRRYGGKLEDFFEYTKQMMEEKQRVLVVSHQANRLSELFQEKGIEVFPVSELKEIPSQGSITLLQSSPGQTRSHEPKAWQSSSIPAEGWRMNNLHLITDAELFGFVKQTKPSRGAPVRRRWLSPQLTVGDYVVHVDHGIGKFRGLSQMSTNGTLREYLILEYAGNDRLYVPTDQIARISSYVGAGSSAPSLSRLGTQEWERVKQRVKESVADIARGMLELYASREVNPGFAFSSDTLWQQELEASFPYVETSDQLEALSAVKDDMEKPRPMDRLICGDVGYGKTEVALRAAFKTVMDDKQVAILVPTTVLAQQHFSTFGERLRAFPIRVEMLSRFCSGEKEREILAGLSNGTVDICIGTHRLLQKDIAFGDLGLMIVDEEQRFGVVQKEKLKQMRKEADVLTLSATPIPRTLHMSLTGLRDMSIIETPPEERLAIKTYVGLYDEQLVRQAILRELERNGQVFFVHNRIESIALVANKLRALIPEARIAVAHGRMPEEELENVMLEFVAGKHDVLLTTTIIESGLDMPNVNTLIVDRADRFGLSQLYQLRGRVGRGSNQAYAYFLFAKDKQLTLQAHKRLRTVFEATELGAGFGIAMKDLEIRGAGNLLGIEQSGHIAAVGFDLYCQLLTEAVEQLKAKQYYCEAKLRAERGGSEAISEEKPEFIPSISLPLTAFIPEEYIPSLGSRLGLYHRLARIERIEEIAEMAQELADRFGNLSLPEPLRNLLYVVEIKILAAEKGIQSVYCQGKQIILDLASGSSIASLTSRHQHKDGIKIGNRQIRLDIKCLGSTWQEELRKLLRG